MTLKRFLLSSSFALFALHPAAAQTPTPEQTSPDQEQTRKLIERKKELERKTLLLLDEVIAGIPALRLPENRALVQSSAADLLWPHDEKRARALFSEALNSLIEINNQSNGRPPRSENAEVLAQRQRNEILGMIARRDPQLALDALRATRPAFLPVDPVLKERQHHSELELEQSLALQVAASDPKRALQMAKDGLAKGFTVELINVIRRLQAVDGEAATRLAEEIVTKLRAEKLAASGVAEWIAFEILLMTQPRPPGPQFLGAGQAPLPRTQLKLDEKYLRDLSELIATAASAENSHFGRFNLGLLQSVMPLIERYAPERAPLLRKRIEEANRGMDERFRMYSEYGALLRSGTVDELLDAAAQAKTTDAREMLYEQAIWKALAQGDAERARRIVNEKLQNSPRREQILESLERQALWHDVMEGKLDEARQRIARLKSKDERALALSSLAFTLATKGEKKIALQLLEEARSLAQLRPKNEPQLSALLQIVRAYAVADPVRCFELIETLVDQSNELISAAATLDGFVGSGGAFKRGELVLPPGYAAASTRYQQYGKQLAALALVNFDRTKAAADRFQRREVRLLARLFIAQGVLSERLGSVAPIDVGVLLSGD